MRKYLAVWTGKLVLQVAKVTKLGGGSAAPGLYALKTDPDLVIKLAKSIRQNVIITGTNGKTTTARLLYNFAKSQGLKVIRNATGSNMERGIASKLIEHSNLFAHLPDFDLGIWEVDEATLKLVLPKIKPAIIVFLNAARDQLDRYGELDSLVREWRESLEALDYSPLVLINGDDANTYSLKGVKKGLRFESFGTGNDLIKWEKQTFRPKLDFKASDISQKGLESLSFNLSYPQDKEGEKKPRSIHFPLPGLYHIYDILASFAVGHHLNLPAEAMVKEIASYTPVFGRVEQLNILGHEGYIFLIKNPTSTTEVFNTIKSQLRKGDRLLLALNDNLADGIDVSWIWDAQFEKLVEATNSISEIVCSGERASDLALRLKYAGVAEGKLLIEPDLSKALKISLNNLSGRIFILPTYTALLELQKILAKMGVKKHYWEEVD